jgi:hypothetical protein
MEAVAPGSSLVTRHSSLPLKVFLFLVFVQILLFDDV